MQDLCQAFHERSADQRKGPASRLAKVKVVYFCQVDGCNVKLSNCKPYCVRYRVCPSHLAASSVKLQGVICRFCQQCGKFHSVDEFDGTKRSCRSRLQHHNNSRQQRRKEAALHQSINTSLMLQQRGTRQAAKQHRIITSFISPNKPPESPAASSSMPKRTCSEMQQNSSNSLCTGTSTELDIQGSPEAESGNNHTSHQHQQQPANQDSAHEAIAAAEEHRGPQPAAAAVRHCPCNDEHAHQQLSAEHCHQQQVQQRQRQRITVCTSSNTHMMPAATASAATSAGLMHTADGLRAAALPRAEHPDIVSADRQNLQATIALAGGLEQQPPAPHAGVTLSCSTKVSIGSAACFAGHAYVRPGAAAAAAGPQWPHDPAAAGMPAETHHGHGGSYHMHSAVPECADCADGAVTVRYCNAPGGTQRLAPPFSSVNTAAMQRHDNSSTTAQRPLSVLPTAAAAPSAVDAAAASAGLYTQTQDACSSLYGRYRSSYDEAPTWCKQRTACYQPCSIASLWWSSHAEGDACGAAERQQPEGQASVGFAARDLSPNSNGITHPAAVLRPGSFSSNTADAATTAAAHGTVCVDGAAPAGSQQPCVQGPDAHSINRQLAAIGAVGHCNWGTDLSSQTLHLNFCQGSTGRRYYVCDADSPKSSSRGNTATGVPGYLAVPDEPWQYKPCTADRASSSTTAGSNGNALTIGSYEDGYVASRYHSQLQMGNATAVTAFGAPGAAGNPFHPQPAVVAANGATVLDGQPMNTLPYSACSTVNQCRDVFPPGSSDARGHAAAVVAAADGATQATAAQAALLQQWNTAGISAEIVAAGATHIREPDSCWLPQQQVLQMLKQHQQQRQQLQLPRLLAPEVVARHSPPASVPDNPAAAGLPGPADLQPDLTGVPSAAAVAACGATCFSFADTDPPGMQTQPPAAAHFTAAENAYLDSLAAAMAGIQRDAEAASGLAPTRLPGPGLDAWAPANPGDLRVPGNLTASLTGQAGGGPDSLAGPEHVAMRPKDGTPAAAFLQPSLPFRTSLDPGDSRRVLVDVFKQWGSEEHAVMDDLLAPMLDGAFLTSGSSADDVDEFIDILM